METRIKELMEQKGVMSKTLAEKMHLTPVAVSALINGKSNNLETLAKAAQCLDVPLWQLFKEPDEETQSNTGTIICPHCGKRITIKVE